MKILTLLPALLITVSASATTYYTTNFANSIPSAFTLVNADGCELKNNIYLNVGKDMSAAWVAGQLGNGYGRAALSPTRHTDPTVPSEHWMTLPAIRIADSDAILRWEARSLHKHFVETYRVAARVSGDGDWTDLYVCNGENYRFTNHCLSLSQYQGQDLEIAFIATTQQGFMLAVDNIFVGVPDSGLYVYESSTPHYIADLGAAKVTGTLTNYGKSGEISALKLSGAGDDQTIQIPQLGPGESTEVEFTVYPTLGETYNYSITGIGADKPTDIYTDFISCSNFRRLQVIDRCSGTWCNNCPVTELTTSRLEHMYGEDLIVLEAHVNDQLMNAEYWADYLGSFVVSIPSLVPNHDPSRLAYSIKATDDFSAQMERETIAEIAVSTESSDNGEVRITSTVSTSKHLDNTDDRYRVAYMLIADIHDALNPNYLQYSQSGTYRDEQYYYQPSVILPEMMYYENVPIDATVAYNGVPGSLPTAITAGERYGHQFSLPIPARTDISNLRVLAMIVDTSTGTILNAGMTDATDTNACPTIGIDQVNGVTEYYDITGRRIERSTGFYIERCGSYATKKSKR